jgi:hypothetical protein
LWQNVLGYILGDFLQSHLVTLFVAKFYTFLVQVETELVREKIAQNIANQLIAEVFKKCSK